MDTLVTEIKKNLTVKDTPLHTHLVSLNNHNLIPIQYKKVENTNLKMPISGPLDHLEPDELMNRLNYLYYTTSHPYKPMNYLEYKSHDDNELNRIPFT